MGTDDGCVYLFSWSLDKIEEVELIFLERVHKKRVMGVWFDAKRSVMFTISEDKHLKSYSTTTKEMLTSKFS